jgi:hypothetical protein
MTKLSKTILFATSIAVAAIVIAAPAMAAVPSNIAGGFQGWDPGATPISETFPGSGIYQYTAGSLTPGSYQEFKLTDGTWNNTWLPSGNAWGYADANGNLAISYDFNAYVDGWTATGARISVTGGDLGTWTAVGDWQSQVSGGNWDNANAGTAMTSLGGGIYEFSATLAPGNYNWKAVDTGTWEAIGNDGRSVNADNVPFTTTLEDPTVDMFVNAVNGTIKFDVVPEPSSIALVVIGLLGAVGMIRRRNA